MRESFIDTTSDTWAFGRVERVPGAVKDFLVFYNPNDHAAVVTLTAALRADELSAASLAAPTSRRRTPSSAGRRTSFRAPRRR